VPSLSLALATFLGLGSFALFAAFIGHIASMLQPSSVIASISAEARAHLDSPYPAEVGEEPEDGGRAGGDFERAVAGRRERPVRLEGEGFLTEVRADHLLEYAEAADLYVRQVTRVGAYLLPGEAVATAWLAEGGEEDDAVEERLRAFFSEGSQRTLPQDPSFPVRQLADVALKGLSPGINDPTTAANAMEAMSAALIRFACAGRPCLLRADGDGRPRFWADAPDLDDLTWLGFEQVIHYAEKDPALPARLRELLERIAAAARQNGLETAEIERLAASAGAEKVVDSAER
jgi:uncharacterized membrane protein